MTLEEALAKIAELEAANSQLTNTNAALQATRDGLLGDLTKIKKQYRDPLGDIDPTEAAAIAKRYQSGELVTKESIEGELKTQYEGQASQQMKELQGQLTEIKERLAAETAAKEQATLKGAFTSILASQLKNKPQHMMTLLEAENRIKLVNGRAVGLYKGEELEPDEFVSKLREDPDYQDYFKPTGVSGSGNEFTNGSKKIKNPFAAGSRNITEQMRLLKTNPELARKLEAEA